jgi:hypothetical protein
MRITSEALSVSVVVRRVTVGSAPFGWEIHCAGATGPIHVSADRFRSMEAAYRAGQARLGDFIPKRSTRAEDRQWAAGRMRRGVPHPNMGIQEAGA